jgi:pyruvate/2-oxoglutarate dehydrogenase complex dihydrolipoamide dehydrogenase (E3) component
VQGQDQVIGCSHVLVAAGRVPNTESLNLAAAAVHTNDKGQVVVNDRLETSQPDIYALGDVKGGPEFTHISYHDHVVLVHNLLEGRQATIAGRPVPYCMFTDPPLGRVGLTEAEARQQGLAIKVATMPMSRVARAVETGDTRGLMKVVVAAGSGQILGGAILGQEGGETMSLLQMAMAGGIPYRQIQEMIFAHPLYAESLNNLFLKLDEPT